MAIEKSSVDTQRKKIADVVPLDSPLSMYVEPTRICNFKCFYCMHGTRGIQGGVIDKSGFTIANMDMNLYEKLVSEVMAFPAPLKRICFSGLGEPLANRNLPKMIKMLRDAGFEGRIDVISNGSLLTHEMTDELVAAGLSRIQISIQGLTTEKYKEVSGVNVDPKDLVEKIRYFYEHKGNSVIYVKIIDALLDEVNTKEVFYKMFGDICDMMHIEHLVVMQQQMGEHGRKVDRTRNLMGEYVEPRECCGVMFYFLNVNIDGDTFPCSTPGLPTSFSMGNMKEQTLTEIWNGRKRNTLIRANLISGYRSIPACSECSSCIAIADESEYVDPYREQMLEKFPVK